MNKLPEVKYDDEYINQIKKPIPKYFLSPHQLLPKIKNNNRYSLKKIKSQEENNKDLKKREEIKNDINENNKNDKIIFKNNNLKINKVNIMNTLRMKINQKRPFNHKGEIDIIIEE